jgi:dTDP-4-amino-4,6-dideoxygalactose transaminase
MPYKVVKEFEDAVSDWAGAKYGIAVESCTSALFLCCVYCKVKTVTLPKYTYPSVACSVIHAGGNIKFTDEKWKGVYKLKPYPIIDGALRFRKGMYQGGLHCLSFHNKKHLPIGRGGMIITDDGDARDWLVKARYDGRSGLPLAQERIEMVGWNMYMTPEQAVRGLMLFSNTQDYNKDMDSTKQNYPDLSKINAYRN